MAHGLRLSRPGHAWAGLAAGLAAAALLGWWLPAPLLDWQPALVRHEPWRAFSAAFVHWSDTHLAANLAGTAVLAALGLAGRLPARATLAWLLAWPLTHLGLAVMPTLTHYGGLSGVLHAGVAVAATWLVATAAGTRRRIGAAIAVGLLLKLLLEEPWGAPLRAGSGWDIATAPLAHATGALAGLLCAAVVLAWPRRPVVRADTRPDTPP
ncbi:MAG: rhombosortase [Leptothrix sp. (in: Bacteria)]|nr:rhombosortase [Leptothrix sp. (in: b-proteobacteria)]